MNVNKGSRQGLAGLRSGHANRHVHPAALSTTSAQRALAVPTAYVTINYSNAHVTYFWTPRTEAGAQAARLFVHSREQCGDAFCTIQEGTPGRYHIWRFSGCGRFTLQNFKGEWDTHNHGSLTVNLRNQQREIIARYAGGRSTNVVWDPYWHVSTCNR
ncbi:hypothetical protein [Nonomuraea sp. KM88]|uniref:hypothetical protein n=1 Tax=Nonomuraea sp. KM88 TaxID=3457427 RepID=UPI003FCEB963